MDPGARPGGLLGQVTCSLAEGLAPGGTIQSLGQCSGGQRGGAVALLPEHGVRRTVPQSSGGSPSPGCPETRGQDPGRQEGDLPGEGPPGVQQARLRGGKTEARGEGRRVGTGDKHRGRALCWTQSAPHSEQVDRQMDRLCQCCYSALGRSTRELLLEEAAGLGWGRETWVSGRFPERKQRRPPAGQGPHTTEGDTPGVERRQPRQEPNACIAR